MSDLIRVHIHVEGIVQGVGFRPFLHRHAKRLCISGWVRNTSEGVEAEAQGSSEHIDSFLKIIKNEPPPMALIESIRVRPVSVLCKEAGFVILDSRSDSGNTLISPDIGLCADCRRELHDPSDRRYHYPFINCTNCGPRFTIICGLPYDRDKTTMAAFTMCPKCRKEYSALKNRRYHAQPDACPVCGPHVFFTDGSGKEIAGDPMENARKYLSAGKIIAVKGLGGIHLACDAQNEAAIQRLRQIKRRPQKPLALMCASLDDARRLCRMDTDECRLLSSPARPIVLLNKRSPRMLSCCASGPRIGLMLPYTPVHELLFTGNTPRLLVMTSANRPGCPVIIKNEDVLDAFSGRIDGFLLNNRAIANRCDDSLLDLWQGKAYFFRRSRGYAPSPVSFPGDHTGIFAFGAEQKGSFALGDGSRLFLPPHIGDLKNMETFEHYETMLKTYARLFKIRPKVLVCDRHPDYWSTALAKSIQKSHGLPLIQIQHHWAHMASCMADNRYMFSKNPETAPAMAASVSAGTILDTSVSPVEAFGIIWDGTGLGSDGTIWGAEFLKGNYSSFTRVGSIRPILLAGGDRAAKEVGRIALALLKDSGLPPGKAPLSDAKASMLYTLLDQPGVCPRASSMGRLFDGVGALLKHCQEISYDGEAAEAVEHLAASALTDEQSLMAGAAPYPLEFYEENGIRYFDTRPMLRALVSDMESISTCQIARRFTATLCHMALNQTKALNPGHLPVFLSGGVFLNHLLRFGITRLLEANGYTVFTHHRVSPGDEGLALGQAVIASALYAQNEHPQKR